MFTEVKSVINKNITFLVVALLLCLLMWLTGASERDIDVEHIPPIVSFSAECKTLREVDGDTFTIFVQEKEASERLLKLFCNDQIVAKQFSKVKVHWGIDDSKTMMLVGKGIADLTMVKHNLMEALAATRTHSYEAIAAYPDYKVFLIAMNEKPQLTKEYLLDKTIGLLNYPTSRSGHIVPKQLFTDLGLSLDKLNIVYAGSHEELRELLASSQVDLISSYWQAEDAEQFSSNYATQVQDGVAGNTWYLRMHKNNTLLYCATQQILAEYATQQTLNYYSQLKLLKPELCQ